ncbi:SDR family oxidoreductase [Streptomyces sp. CB01881]|uniref:SDR family NAD(P)-dependent oxidoreductase n=1 Tax=Streptomyces sp. CB01881 TaxID=2078691 RepID=UPI000CDC47CE|nr:SDR family oxidoreductase [Streptomyces sp. CB01881]AUY52821.1 hypothetical protein C2142_32350 [Streptomyces sp. CB01881]TYC70540.1 SDR family oxidoreductase [Streptomyces sp. CB01881]
MAGRWRAGFTTAFDLVAALSELLTLGAEETPERPGGGLTRAAAVEWGPRGVRCNAVAPGVVPVERNRHVWTDPETSAAMLRAAPLGRFGSAAEVARVVAFLAGGDASFVNGACLAVDGGMTAMPPEALLR